MENNPIQAEALEAEQAESAKSADESNYEATKKQIEAGVEEVRRRSRESQQAMKEGKGRLRLETPIKSGDMLITELVYDFTDMTGIDYTDAMDSDPNSQQIFRITYRQALALFAQAAARHTDRLDRRDIIERIGATDALEGVQLATLFFTASARAGRLRISKM